MVAVHAVLIRILSMLVMLVWRLRKSAHQSQVDDGHAWADRVNLTGHVEGDTT